MEVISSGRRRQLRSKTEILELLEQQQQSGLTIQAFCKEQSIPSGSFHNWKKKISTVNKESSAFAPVQISSSVTLFAEVNGIKIYQPVSAGFLKELAS